jgi:hypothetical protein
MLFLATNLLNKQTWWLEDGSRDGWKSMYDKSSIHLNRFTRLTFSQLSVV